MQPPDCRDVPLGAPILIQMHIKCVGGYSPSTISTIRPPKSGLIWSKVRNKFSSIYTRAGGWDIKSMTFHSIYGPKTRWFSVTFTGALTTHADHYMTQRNEEGEDNCIQRCGFWCLLFLDAGCLENALFSSNSGKRKIS